MHPIQYVNLKVSHSITILLYSIRRSIERGTDPVGSPFVNLDIIHMYMFILHQVFLLQHCVICGQRRSVLEHSRSSGILRAAREGTPVGYSRRGCSARPLLLLRHHHGMSLLSRAEFSRSELLQMELLSLLDELLSLIFQRLPLLIHDCFQFLEVAQLDFEFLHLGFHQQCDERLDFAFLDSCEVLSFHSCGAERCGSCGG